MGVRNGGSREEGDESRQLERRERERFGSSL